MQEWVECCKEFFWLFNVRHMPALVQNHEIGPESTRRVYGRR